MSFLAPLYIAGILAVSLPILFHLFRRTPQGRQVFSSLMFLVPSPPRLTRRSRLENWPLLLLRALILTLLALAFARPLWRQIAQAEVDPSRGRWIAILVDTSASMRRENLWQQAKSKVDELLGAVSPLDRVALFTFDRQPRTIIDFATWNEAPHDARAGLVRDRLAEITPTWAETNLAAALVSVADAIDDTEANSERERPNQVRRIVLITDLQQGSHVEALQSYQWPAAVDVTVEQVKPRITTNASLELVQDAEVPWQVTDQEGPRVRVTNAADSTTERFRIAWRLREAATEAPSRIDAYVPPGQSRVVRGPPLPPNATPESLVLEGDAHDFDNRLFVIPPQQQRVTVLFVGSDSPDDAKQLLYYLLPAFPETPWLAVRVTSHKPDGPLLPGELDGVPLVIVGESISAELQNTLRRYMQEGGAVLAVLTDAEMASSLGGLIERDDFAASEATVRQYAMLEKVDFGHPLFAPLADPRFSDFTKIHIWRRRQVDEKQFANARVAARFDGGDPALVEQPLGKGVLYVLATSWRPIDSQLALSSKFVPLLHGFLHRGGIALDRLPIYHVGDRVELNRAQEADALATVRRPDGKEIPQPEAGSPWEYTQTDVPGIYTVSNSPDIPQFAVNLAASESKTAPLAVEELEKLGVRLTHRGPELPKEELEAKKRQMLAVELENRQKLWRWAIVAALVVLVFETWLAGWLTHRSAAAA